ncbi:MAG TPA: hypothetical protein VFG68_10570, partial [Fimbriiglobus sp.]|nr:hypothetical protein [Fimbriiglobus sp.]
MSAELAELNAVAAELPPDLVRKVIDYARFLTKPYWEHPGYSDEWTDADMRDFTAESMRYYDQCYP